MKHAGSVAPPTSTSSPISSRQRHGVPVASPPAEGYRHLTPANGSPSEDCKSLVCVEPSTIPPPGSPCVCVLPIRVGLRLSTTLYTFFPLVPVFAQEIAFGIYMKQSQVRIMGANVASDQPENTIVLIDLVPVEEKFDTATAFLSFEKFWHKDIVINTSLFGDYTVLYVLYPGLQTLHSL
ncbi:hypothetical protein BHE74_00020558 [Ensete ventricosum]|nr:hypothetical protein BHE74_00020558 [Ensete ventricosum]